MQNEFQLLVALFGDCGYTYQTRTQRACAWYILGRWADGNLVVKEVAPWLEGCTFEFTNQQGATKVSLSKVPSPHCSPLHRMG